MEDKKLRVEEMLKKGVNPDHYNQLSTTRTRNNLSIMLAAIGAGLILLIFGMAIFKTNDPSVIKDITDKALLVVSGYIGATLPTIITSMYESKSIVKDETNQQD